MRNKGLIITGILALTITIIVFIRFYISRDNIQTQKAQIDFYSDHLTEQKNYILNSFLTTSKLAFRQISQNHALNEIVEKAHGNIQDKFIITTIQNHFSSTHQFLEEAGFSDLNLVFTDSTGTYYLRIGPHKDCQTMKQTFNNFDPKKNSENPIHGFSICENHIGYKFIYPWLFDSIKKEFVVFVEIGFDFEQLPGLITHNPGNLEIGYIISLNENDEFSDIMNLRGFTEHKEYGNIWTNNKFSIPNEFEVNKRLKKEFIKEISVHTKVNGETDFSIFIPSRRGTKVITLSSLNLLGLNGCVFLVSINRDYVLDKTRDWNNQIFIINLIIILLIMFGISYLILNRINLEKQKEKIQTSEKKLLELNRSKDKFFSILAHDLKNPFNGILGMSEYLDSNFKSIKEDEKREIINDITIASKNAFNLLQNLLEWTRTQSGSIKNIPSVIDPKEIFELSLETVINLAKNKEIGIVKTFLTNKKGWADENLVATVLRNLFTNAVKFSPRKSTIEAIVKAYKDELVFCVKDEGAGLRSDEIDQLFRIDVNFHKRGTEQETGTGLGLKICKEFAAYCNGRIWVVSKPGKGSEFYFTIPTTNSK